MHIVICLDHLLIKKKGKNNEVLLSCTITYLKNLIDFDVHQLSENLLPFFLLLPLVDMFSIICSVHIMKKQKYLFLMQKRRGGWPKGRKRKPEIPGVKPPKAPLTAYVLFLNERRKYYKETRPELSFGAVSIY